MKYLSKLLLLIAVSFAFSACEKIPDLPFYGEGNPVTLSASATDIAANPADSNNVALTLNWTFPNYATDSSNMKYVIEIDSAGRNFSKAVRKSVSGTLSTTYLAKEINNIALGYGFEFGKPYNMDIRIISSYENNNEQLTSNTITLKVTPYKAPPEVALHASGALFLVGDASQGGWNNPVPVPTQQFTQIDETTFAGVFELVGGNQYLVLPVNGSWDEKYSIQDNQLPDVATSGSFGYGLPANFAAPATSGWYKITLYFQSGTYTVTPYAGNLPTNLYMVGDATPGEWNNPVPLPSQQFTRLNSSEFELTLALNGGKSYLFLPLNGNWDHKYAVQDASVAGLAMGGELGYDFGQNIPGPAESGTYKINVNFAKGEQGIFTVTKQ